jgi:predicted nucleic acid-binding protein
VFIYDWERHPLFGAAAGAVLDAVEAGALVAVASTLLLAELLVGPYRAGRPDAVDLYVRRLTAFPNLTLVPPDVAVCRAAAQLRGATPRLRLADAIHLATALESGATAFVTNDLDLRRVGQLAVVRLSELRI